jgi:hypothetical protein
MRTRAAALPLALVAMTGNLVGCGTGCPAALLEGVLVRAGNTLVVHAEYGDTNLQWPVGYGIREANGRLVITDFFGSVKAREGDIVHLGGGMVPPDEKAFGVCGEYRVDPA